MSITVYNFYYTEALPKVSIVERSGLSLADLIDYLASAYHPAIKDAMIVDGELAGRGRVSINGVTVNRLDAWIPDGGELILSMIVEGG